MRLAEKKARGFTLIEMAIVLVIIGIILAGVMKGRDIVRGAQIKQFSQQFAQKWTTVAQTYYDKTGQQLNDGGVNGGATSVSPDGWMDGDMPANSDTIKTQLENVGIDLCAIIKSKIPAAAASNGATDPDTGSFCTDGTNDIMNPWQYSIDGEFANNAIVTVDTAGLLLTIGGKDVNRNVVMLYNVPTDVARGIDTAIDGKADGVAGSCVGLGTSYDLDGASDIANNIGGTAITATAWQPAYDGGAKAQTVGIILEY